MPPAWTAATLFDALWQRLSWKGQAYGLPSIEAALILALSWNENLFERNGLDPGLAPTTWEEVRTVSNAIINLIYINRQEQYTLAIGLTLFNSQHSQEWALLMAASTVSLMPVLLLFFFAQRTFIEGISMTGIKG